MTTPTSPLPEKRPAWLKVKVSPPTNTERQVNALLENLHLETVCRGARCPNRLECHGTGRATFLLLGPICTRRCGFCSVQKGTPSPLDPTEPERIAAAVEALKLRYVVLTSVTRDDLPDGGADGFASVVQAIRKRCPGVSIETLIPDFRGERKNLEHFLKAGAPDVLNHNLETVPRLYPAVRPGATVERSLTLLAWAKEITPSLATKSGLMVGLGEREEEVQALLLELRRVGVDYITIGQYLSPGGENLPVREYIRPEQFEAYRNAAEKMGFKEVASAPFVRSSYRAEEMRAKDAPSTTG